jgi:hypothetical protein
MMLRYDQTETGLLKMIRENESTTHVDVDDVKSGRDWLLSEFFGPCHGVAFLDETGKGALGHSSICTPPHQLFRGYSCDALDEFRVRPIENIRDTYPSPDTVRVMHVYHTHEPAYEPEIVEEALRNVGFERVQRVALFTQPNQKRTYRTLAVNPRRGMLYIFTSSGTEILTVPFFKDE